MSIRRQSFVVVAVLAAVYLLITLSRDLVGLFSARERITKEERTVAELQTEQQQLAQEIEYVASEEFVEKEAREKLLMSKPGEVVVLDPHEEQLKVGEKTGDGAERELANWEKWVHLFF